MTRAFSWSLSNSWPIQDSSSEMTYNVSSGTLNITIPYRSRTVAQKRDLLDMLVSGCRDGTLTYVQLQDL